MKKLFALWPIFLFLFLTIIIFRPYVFSGKVPFAGNLLVSFYEPWKSYSWGGYGANGPSNKPIGFDSLRIFYPLRSLTIDSFKHFQLPLWNPYDFAGNTQLATYQSAVFFPLTPLFLFLPQIDAWSLTVFIAPFLASMFTYFFLRFLKLSKQASVIGALSFGFSCGIIVLLEESFMSAYSLLFLPLMLLSIFAFFQNRRFKWFALFILAGICSVFSGWFQSTLYIFLLSFAWLVFLGFQTKNLKTFLFVLFGFLLAFLISAPHLLPNIESYLYSARGTTDAKFLFDTYLLKPWELITYYAPDFFGNPGTYSYFGKGFFYERVISIGTVGLILGLICLIKKKKVSIEWFFCVSWIITILLGVFSPVSYLVLYQLHLPIISTILPSRIFLLGAFCLSVMASYGFESFSKNPPKKSLTVVSIFSLIILGMAWIFVIFQKAHHPLSEFSLISFKNLFLPTGLFLIAVIGCIFLCLKAKNKKTIGFLVLLFATLTGIIYFANKYLYFSERTFTFPQSPVLSKLQEISGNNRVWSYGEGYLVRNFATQYHLESPEGYDSFYIRTFGEFIEASKNNGKYTINIPRADAQLVNVNKLSEIDNNASLKKVLSLLGVKYLFAKENADDKKYIAENASFKKVWSDGKFVIYQNLSAMPRAFLVNSYLVISDPQQQLATLFDPQTDLSKTIILDKDPKLLQTSSVISGSTIITSYQSQQITIKTITNKNALLFLSDNNYPGWKAYVDGKQAEIFTADHTFRAVVVPSGKHIVVFRYQPVSVLFGFGGFLLGVLLFALTGFTIKKLSK